MPHPSHLIRHLDQRHAGYLAESAQDQRARIAERTTDSSFRQRCLDLLATLVALVVLALLVAAGAEAFITPAIAPLPVGLVLP